MFKIAITLRFIASLIDHDIYCNMADIWLKFKTIISEIPTMENITIT